MEVAMAFRLLGPVAIVDKGGAPLALGSPRRQAVLAALVVHRGAVLTVDALIDMLWPGHAPPTAATMVHGAVSAIRKLLAEGGVEHLLATRSGGYVLDARPDQVDAACFEQLVDQGRRLLSSSPSQAARVLAEALDLWHGPALAGIDVEFARSLAAHLDELRVECAELRVEAELRRGRHREVLGEVKALAAQHPLRERLSAQLMIALYRCGLQADALAAYRTLRRTMAADLGLEPGPELRRLELAVLRQDEDLEWRAITALPHPIGAFIGRVAEQVEVTALIEAQRLVTLTGPGGSGKTRLALEVARALEERGRVDVALVDLASLTGPELLDETVAEALGVRGAPGQPLSRTIAAAFAQRDTVIVLDNCEHLIEACATLVYALLSSAPRIRVLATSREPLGVPGEHVYAVRPLRLAADHADWSQIVACESVQLFASRAASAAPGFAVTPGNARLVLDVCRRLDGLPLALELAAARAASLPLPVLAERLADRFQLLDSAARSPDRRHRGLAAAVGWSYDLLTEPERLAFTRVATFPASFALDAAEAVAGPDLPGHDVALLLARLVACSVVQLEGLDGMRYRLLETAREFARQRLLEDNAATLHERHARHYLRQAEAIETRLFVAGSAPWLAQLHTERANLRAALEWAFGSDGEPETGVRLVKCLWHYWDLRGLRSEGLRWVDAALDAVGPERAADRLPLLSAGALLHLGRAEFEATEKLAREQVALARATAARGWEGDALGMVATVAWARGRFDRAQQLYEDAIAASLAGGDLWRAAMEEAQLARLHRDRNEPDAARAMAARSLAHAEETGEELARGLALDVLASLEQRWGDTTQARRLVEEALAHYRRVEYREGEASALHLAGQIALAAHEPALARAAFDRSLRLCRRIGHRAGMAAALEGLAAVGDDPADRLTGEAAALRAEIGVPRRD
jgi:predicted ATPase/DNA-binding SARP family transcriptional activator